MNNQETQNEDKQRKKNRITEK